MKLQKSLFFLRTLAIVEAVIIVGLVSVIVCLYLISVENCQKSLVTCKLQSGLNDEISGHQLIFSTQVHKKRHRRHCHNHLRRVRKHHRVHSGSVVEKSEFSHNSDLLTFLGFNNESSNLRFTLQALSIVRSLTEQLKKAKENVSCSPQLTTSTCPVCSCNTETSYLETETTETQLGNDSGPIFTERSVTTSGIETTTLPTTTSFSYPTPGAFIHVAEIRQTPDMTTATKSIRIFTEPTTRSWNGGVPDEKGTFKTERECYLDLVGIPVFNSKNPLPGYEFLIPRFHLFGSWFRDSNPPDSDFAKRRWVLKNWYNSDLDEYPSTEALYHRTEAVTFHINERIAGTGSVVHNGFFYFHLWNTPYLMKYNLKAENLTLRTELPKLAYQDCDPDKPLAKGKDRCEPPIAEEYLYGQAHNFVDFSIDENGLWVIYHYSNESFLVVSKLDWDTLKPIATYELKSHHIRDFSNSFIMCGVFYGINANPTKQSSIDFVYSLHQNRQLPVGRFDWTNPFESVTMVDYNPYDRLLYIYDKGRLLTVPVRVVPTVKDLSSYDRRYRSHL